MNSLVQSNKKAETNVEFLFLRCSGKIIYFEPLKCNQIISGVDSEVDVWSSVKRSGIGQSFLSELTGLPFLRTDLSWRSGSPRYEHHQEVCVAVLKNFAFKADDLRCDSQLSYICTVPK